MKFLFLSLTSLVTCTALASPCDGVDTSLSESRKNQLASVIPKKFNIESTEILQSYQYLHWHVIYINNHGNDKGFLYFYDNPMQNIYLTVWDGSVTNEESEIKKFILSNAKIIPSKLRVCIEHATRSNAIKTRQHPLL
ncbi:MAG: hypothetical protein PHD65_02430 [Gallionella sp.]|nr:hypothetical protein [Gallionella sp.]